MELELTTSIVNALHGPYETKEVRLMIYQNAPSEVKEPFVVIHSETHTEIVLFKKVLLKMFMECHHLFYQWESLDTYRQRLVCSGLLIVTTENRTALNMYSKILSELTETSIQREVHFIELLLSCNRAKLNKSSSLWELYKKLYSEYQGRIKFEVWRTIKLSCDQHFANYYCCNFIKWYYNKLEYQQREAFIKQYIQFAMAHVSDPSIWTVLGKILRKNDLDCILNFVESLPVTTWPPFSAVLEFASRNMDIIPIVKERWEQKEGVVFYKGTVIVPKEIEDDLNLRTQYLHDGWKSLLLIKLGHLM